MVLQVGDCPVQQAQGFQALTFQALAGLEVLLVHQPRLEHLLALHLQHQAVAHLEDHLRLVQDHHLLVCQAVAPPTATHHPTADHHLRVRLWLQLLPQHLRPDQSLYPQLHPSQHRQHVQQFVFGDVIDRLVREGATSTIQDAYRRWISGRPQPVQR